MKLNYFTRMGGKSKLRKKIVSLFPNINEYDIFVEPFVGSGQVMLEVLPDIYVTKQIIINDKNKDIYYMWKDLISTKKTGIEHFDWRGDKELYQKLKKKNKFDSTEERFYRNFYISIHSFSGCRDGGYSYKSKNRGKQFFDNMEILRSYLKKIKIFNKDYKNIVNNYDSERTLFYFDPPYLEKEHLYENQKIDPIDMLEICKSIKGYFILSYNCDKRISNLFQNFFIRKVKIRYTSSSNNKKYKYEYIISNFKI